MLVHKIWLFWRFPKMIIKVVEICTVVLHCGLALGWGVHIMGFVHVNIKNGWMSDCYFMFCNRIVTL